MGRGSSTGGGSAWKRKLRKFAKEGKMPSWIAGNKEQQAEVFREIDKLYDMPDVEVIRQNTDEDQAWIYTKWGTSRVTYPHGWDADEAERRGALKFLLYNIKQRHGL